MRRYLSLLLFLWTAPSAFAGYNIDSLFMVLDRTIDSAAYFIKQREDNINRLKEILVDNRDPDYRIDLLDSLFHQYVSYQSDSAMVYLNHCIEESEQLGSETHNAVYYRVRLAQQFSQSGIYYDAAALLDSLDKEKLSPSQKYYYFRTRSNVGFEIANQTKNERLRRSELEVWRACKDSILYQDNFDSDIYLQTLEERLRDEKKFDESLHINDLRLKKYSNPLRRFAIVASCRYQTLKQMKAPRDEQLYWLTESAISDVRNAIMNQSSLWELADILSREGNLDRSCRYISFSWDCATEFHSHARTKQISPILNTINVKYREDIQRYAQSLKVGMWILALISILLLISLYFVVKEHRRLKQAKHVIDKKNEDLSAAVNALDESNHKKERYIGYFLELCSVYIDKLESFRLNVLRKAQHGQLVEYLSNQKIMALKEADQESLIKCFDDAFLELFPTFVEQFNAMLRPDSQIIPPNRQSLTSELRVFALIRLGIDDSAKIAEFLNYSIRTIYNYRTKINKLLVIPKEEFERQLMQIK